MEDQNEDIFSNQYYLYNTTNGLLKKLVQPKKIGTGITGVFVPELKDGSQLFLYAKDLDSTQHKLAIEMFRAIGDAK
ncbi:hypothetical protein [Deminuibacter soli]|uniref:Uncharacterized protein n=1 Tax=Deminuibacter soli TaxID=2291815 RepID=A0A3E1NMK3_9BACT|nr:hypothetical protein [Deminuibacter soli]RFM29064.1 hypothetical protein DXN05_09915 [Deminuibacter soli]